MSILRVIMSCVFATAVLVAFAGDSKDSQLTALISDLDKLHLVTETPHEMSDSTVALCRPPTNVPNKIHEGFRKSAYCNVYVNDSAKETMLSGRGEYPIGSLIVKSKLRSKEKKDIELFTVMRKMADDYDPKNGNWEYSIVDGRSMRVFSRGRIDSCVACHTEYRRTDFVTRAYLSVAAKIGGEQSHPPEPAARPVSNGKSSPPAR